MTKSPRELGFAMPAEWTQHAATWIAWPHNRHDWPGKFAPIPWVFGEVVRALTPHERVRILVNDKALEAKARTVLRRSEVDLDRVDFFPLRTNRIWTRDSGAIFAKNSAGDLCATDWKFNAWAKYDDWKLDDAVACYMAGVVGAPVYQPSIGGRRVVLEGGAIDVDGEGTLLATEECLLSHVQARNPDVDRAAMERVLHDALGAKKVIWLDRGIVGDDTHGHIDDVCRFVAPGRVVVCDERNENDENFAILRENHERLKHVRDARGRKLDVVPLPMPRPLSFNRQRIPASYANFYVANGTVIVPTFNDPADREALGILAELFPGRVVVGIHAVDLVWGLGTLHCMTQQEPLQG